MTIRRDYYGRGHHPEESGNTTSRSGCASTVLHHRARTRPHTRLPWTSSTREKRRMMLMMILMTMMVASSVWYGTVRYGMLSRSLKGAKWAAAITIVILNGAIILTCENNDGDGCCVDLISFFGFRRSREVFVASVRWLLWPPFASYDLLLLPCSQTQVNGQFWGMTVICDWRYLNMSIMLFEVSLL